MADERSRAATADRPSPRRLLHVFQPGEQRTHHGLGRSGTTFQLELQQFAELVRPRSQPGALMLARSVVLTAPPMLLNGSLLVIEVRVALINATPNTLNER